MSSGPPKFRALSAVAKGSGVAPPQPRNTYAATTPRKSRPSTNARGLCQGKAALGWRRSSAPRSMMTNRNSTMIAPAYTVTCTMAMNGAPRRMKNTEPTAKFRTRNSAECPALRLNNMPSAEPTAMAARRKKRTRSGVSVIDKSQIPISKSQAWRAMGVWDLAFGILCGVFHIWDRPVKLPRFHLLRGRLALPRDRDDQHFFSIDGCLAGGEGQLVIAPQHNRFGRAGVLAEAAEDAAQHIDLVGAGVALAGRIARLVGVLRRLHEDRVGGAGRRAQRAPNALLQAVVVALQLVATLETPRHRLFDLRILDRHRLFKILLERRPKTAQDFSEHALNSRSEKPVFSKKTGFCLRPRPPRRPRAGARAPKVVPDHQRHDHRQNADHPPHEGRVNQ